MNEEVQRILNLIAQEKDMSPDLIANAMNRIGYHESWDGKEVTGNIPDRVQSGGGPGRGAFQYEIGKNKSAETALNRIKSFYTELLNEPVPEWVQELPVNYNPAELSLEKQQLLFLADHRQRPKSNFKELETLPVADWWGQYHQTQNDPRKKKTFKQHEIYYEDEQKQIGQAPFSDIPTPQTQPGVLDFQLPEPVITGRVDEPMAQEPEDLTMEELQGRPTYLGRLFD